MRIVMWLVVTALSAWLGYYFPVLWYFAGAMAIFSLICVIHGRISVPKISGEIESCTVRKNEESEISLTLSGFIRAATAELVCENVLTKSIRRIPLKISSGEKAASFSLKINSRECGKLALYFEKVRIYDLCGLTYKSVSADISGSVICLPDYGKVCPQFVSEYAGKISSAPSDYEISGAKEYVQGDDLRRINHKLTQRFQKPYVNELTSDDTCSLCLFFDFACENGNFSDFDRLMDKYVSCGKTLTESGISWRGAFYNDTVTHVRLIKSAEAYESFVRALISVKSEQRKSDVMNLPHNYVQDKIVCFTLNKVTSDDVEAVNAGGNEDE